MSFNILKDEKITELQKEIDKLKETVIEMDRRLCWIEGFVLAKHCFMIKDHHHKSDVG